MDEAMSHQEITMLELQRDRMRQMANPIPATDDTVKLVEAFSSDKWDLDKKRPGMFNRHSLFGDIKRGERLAQIFAFKGLENLRSAFQPITETTWKNTVDSEEMISSFIGFTSRSVGGKERTQLGKTVTEIISSRADQPKKQGFLGKVNPFGGRK